MISRLIAVNRAETIDEIVTIEETARKFRGHEEARKRRIDLSRKLGDRAMEGMPFGIKGFMAIGFPKLYPRSKEYQDLVGAYDAARGFEADMIISIGPMWHRAIGIKANGPDQGTNLKVQPQGKGYYVEAEVLCERALWEHWAAERATIHGSGDKNPYPVAFINNSMASEVISPVREIVTAGYSGTGYDQYADDGTLTHTDQYTQRLLAVADWRPLGEVS